MLLDILAHSTAIALVTFAFFDLLTQPAQLLAPVYDYLRARIHSEWWFNAAIGCAKCKAGQIALIYGWYAQATPAAWLLLVATSIILTHFITQLNNKL